ncbi:MAG TPA: phosphatase PAP2 family protein [Puia sp.]|nr:phosphatase PAP2 family protein [Puia sp.]
MKKFLVVFLLSSQLVKAQSDSAHRSFPVKSFIVPGCLIAYGFFAYHTDATLDLNEYFKEEIWTEDPHQHTHVDNYLQFAPAVAVYGLNIAGIKGKNDLFDASMIYLLANVIMNTVVFAVKHATHELRPDGSDFYSFPSGHTAEAFTSAEFLYQEYRDRSPWIGIAGYGVAASVGYLRMYNNKHWFHDVVAGAGFGIASTRLAYFLYPEIKRLFVGHKTWNSLVLPSYSNGTWSLSLVKEF